MVGQFSVLLGKKAWIGVHWHTKHMTNITDKKCKTVGLKNTPDSHEVPTKDLTKEPIPYHQWRTCRFPISYHLK